VIQAQDARVKPRVKIVQGRESATRHDRRYVELRIRRVAAEIVQRARHAQAGMTDRPSLSPAPLIVLG
jgi:hypothetical protein